MKFQSHEIYAAIFDMDGTMFDTERLRFRMLKEASALIYGEEMSDELLLNSLGLSALSAKNLAQNEYGADYPYEAIRKKADELEVEYVRTYGVPKKDGLIDVLERLKKNEILLAVATSSRRAIAEEYLINADIMKYFDVTVCGDEVQNGKPNPEIFLKAAKEINCDPMNCLIFEDSENGLVAAASSGALPIYIKDIKDADPDIKKLAFQKYESMNECLEDLIKTTKKFSYPKVNDRFPQSNNNLKVGIHGFGAIGGGYISQVFSHWDGYTRPSMIIGATRDNLIINTVNALHKFSINYESIAYEQTIRNIHLIHMDDEEEMKHMYMETEMIALCLPESAIKQQATIIAKGLLNRYETTKKPLTLLIILNKVNAANYVKKQISDVLKKMTSVEYMKQIIENTYFCETVVNRMVSKISKNNMLKQIQMKLNNIEIDSILDENNMEEGISNLLHPKKEDAAKAKKSKVRSFYSLKIITEILQDISDIQIKLSRFNISLFSSETDMTLYVSNNSPILHRLRQVKVVDDISKLQMIKNKLSNGTHAIIAWYASLLGYETIGQGMGDKRVLSLAIKIMEEEIKPILVKESPEYSDYINNFITNFIKRCRFSFKDPCIRVGRDPIRKLQKNERILGTIAMAAKYNVATPLLEYGVTLGFVYAVSLMNPNDKESQILKNLYDNSNSIEDVITYQGELNGKFLHFFENGKDDNLIESVKRYFECYLQNKDIFYEYYGICNSDHKELIS